MKRSIGFALLIHTSLVPVFAAPANQVTQNGITWNFCGTGGGCPAVETGQFANGDWWVLGPLTITSVNPPQSPGRNGSWVNPGFNVNGGHQPFDDRAAFNTYNESLRPVFPFVVNAPLSLVSSVSQIIPPNCALDQGVYTGWSGMVGNPIENCNRSPVKDAAVLTVLTSVPPTNSFRPPYVGSNKTIQFNKNQLDYSKLAQLTPTASNPPLSAVERLIERVNIQTNFWSSESVQPVENSAGYGRDLARGINLALLAANMNYTNSQKETLVVRLAQMGIDFKAIYDIPGQAWYGLGGHGSGRLGVIKFAGDVLNNQAMAQIGLTSHPNRFGELSQTFSVSNFPVGTPASVIGNCTNGGVNCGYGGYDANDIGLPDWGFSHWNDVRNDVEAWLGDSYRRCCTANTWNSMVLASYAMGTEENLPLVLRAYTDRFMQTEPNGWTRSWHALFGEMWDTYRGQYSRQWNPNDLCTEGTSRPAPLQAGVCAGAQEICTLKNWWGGTPQLYSAHSSFYQQTESSCDGRDNDCDGQVDEGCAGGNNSPQVNAGPNRAIVLPANTLTITGTASDDGNPNPPGVLIVQWTSVSGPAAVVFGSANNVVTNVTFPQQGVYVLRLTANDGALQAFDDVQVTVSFPGTANTSPQVNAGGNRVIVLPNSLNLNGTAVDDGLPNPPGVLTVNWSVQSGPGPVEFGNSGVAATSASFSVPGLYTLRLAANDGALTATNDIFVTVEQDQSTASSSLVGTQFVPCMNPSSEVDRESPPICFTLGSDGPVTVQIYSRSGQLIRNLMSENKLSGQHRIRWDRKNNSGETAGSGIYTVVLNASGKKLKIKIPNIQ